MDLMINLENPNMSLNVKKQTNKTNMNLKHKNKSNTKINIKT